VTVIATCSDTPARIRFRAAVRRRAAVCLGRLRRYTRYPRRRETCESVSRVDAAKGDASQIDVLTGVKEAPGERLVNLETDLAVLEYGLAQYRPARVVIDPITAYLGPTDSCKDSSIRGLLAPFLGLIDRYNCVLV
jgi:hypothetical protein